MSTVVSPEDMGHMSWGPARGLVPATGRIQVVSWIKKILKCEKTGHSGTLDPKVPTAVEALGRGRIILLIAAIQHPDSIVDCVHFVRS